MSLKVCVIGAGAAGLCAARHLLGNSNKFTAQVFEQSDVVGGTWVYTEDVGKDARDIPIHSSMYKNLKTNLPKEVMAFPDYPFPESEPRSFLPHEDVRNYLEGYCDHFDLRSTIKFEHLITRVEPSASSSWMVSAKCLSSGQVTQDEFDAILVCNGHYSVPAYPEIKNIDSFKGLQMHSHDFRIPEPFKDLRVAILGAASSGMDICLEVASQASQVYLSHNKPLLQSKLPANLVQVRGIVECITENGFLLSDGSKIQVDALIYCTGYEYSFPFLSDSCSVRVENRQISPLYKHMIHADFPSLGFIGMPLTIVPFPLFDRQIQWFTAILQGQYGLPSSAEMRAEIQAEKESRLNQGIAEKHFHVFKEYQWDYNSELAQLAGIPDLPKSVENLYNVVGKERRTNLATYKRDSFQMVDGQFVKK